jgi:hypothetical protein
MKKENGNLFNSKNLYDDIINLPAHKSKKHPPMSLSNRAAQFAPFSALVGHKDVINEAARQTGHKVELEEDAFAGLNEKLEMIQEGHWKHLEIIITYFVPDEKKQGGAYAEKVGMVKMINQTEGHIVMEDGTCILLEDICEIDVKP